MSYEEIGKNTYENDVFTGGAEGRYAKAKAPVADTADKKTEKKKKAPKIEAEVKPADQETTESAEKPKTKKKPRATEENGSEPTVSAETSGDTSVKPKKKRAPKIETDRENIDPVVASEIPPAADEPVKKKKAKAPKAALPTEETLPTDQPVVNAYEEPIGDIVAPKVKKTKKSKTTATAAVSESIDMNANGSETLNYGGFDVNPAMAEGSAMGTAEIPMETKQQSEYEQAITNAFNNLASKISFTEYVGGDVWSIIHPPKTARMPNRTGIRKIMPGGSHRQDPRLNKGRGSLNPPATKGGFFNRMKSTVSTLVRDENNLIFGETSNYEVAYFEDEEDGVDTDDLHRYAQKLRELEDADREVNPDVIVIRGGKTVFGVHETDAEGKTVLSKRKPIYDRAADQEAEGAEETSKKKFGLGRLRHAFTKAKDRDGKGDNSPKSSTGTPDSNEKNSKRKSSKKQNDEYAMAMTPGQEPV